MNIIIQVKTYIEFLQAGKAVANPEVWHKRGLLGTTLVVLLNGLVGVLQVSGYNINIPGSDIHAIAQGLDALWFVVLTCIHTISNDKVGFTSKDG